MSMSDLELTCERAVDMVTEYLEGELDEAEQLRYELHAVLCKPCKVHIDKMQRSIEALAGLSGVALPPKRRQSLIALFSAKHDG
jgi:hypothetical protein